MSYQIRLFLTHSATAIVAGYCVWYGLQVQGFSRLAFMVLFGASIIVPNQIAVWWLTRGLRRMSNALSNVTTDAIATGLPELDHVTDQIASVFARQRSMVRNVEELVSRLGHSTAGSGRSRSEIGNDLLTDALGQLSRATARDVGGIMTLADDVARSSHDTLAGAQEQLKTIDNATSSAQTLSTIIDGLSRQSAASGQAADEVAEYAAMGLDLIEQLVSGLESIRANVEYSEKKVTTLGRQSEQIGAIAESMGSLSTRTDMLALNASIEAVRAGQDGRGFALVAEEVRRLAESTATASRNIAGLVNEIQSDACDTVSALSEERQQVQEEIRRVGDAGQTLESISRSSKVAAKRSQQIAAAAVEQLQCTQDMARAMQQVSTIANRIGERSESIRSKSAEIVGTAQALEEGLSPVYHYGDSGECQPDSTLSYDGVNRLGNEATPEAGDALLNAVANGEFAR